MAWKTCDVCSTSEGYSEENPFVHYCQQRPSDHSDMCCVLAGHLRCLSVSTPAEQLPSITDTTALATPAQLEEWIESEDAAKKGYCFIT